MSMLLTGTAESVTVVLASAPATNQLHVTASWADQGGTGGDASALTSGVTAIAAVAAPAAGVSRVISGMSIYNADTAPATVTVARKVSSTSYTLAKVTLPTGYLLAYSNATGWKVCDTSGALVQTTPAGALTNPMTTAGDLIVAGSGGTPTRLAKGADGTVLGMVSGAEAWVTPSAGSLGSSVTALAISSGVVNIDCSLGDYFTLAINANVTSLTFSNLPASGTGRTLSVTITQDATGSRTFALPSSFKAISGSDTAIQPAANAVTKMSIETVNAGTTWAYVMRLRA
jgi:hypothetical protein